MNITEKVAYIKGLVDGMEFEGSTPEKKEPLPETEKSEADTPEAPEAETPAVDEVPEQTPEQPKDGGEGEENKA